ncbi:MAG: PQQ-like beta-propeller repeat protein, partial [Treponema sp.]|nr:PQQ-like beta-propeller repeat protein [Treponema sp.]
MKKPCFVLFLTLLFLLPFRLFAQGAEIYAPSTDAPMWRQALGGVAIGRPVAQVQSVVVATDGGNVLSFSSQGRPLWNFFARGRLTPYISRSREGTTYLGRLSGQLIAINRVGRELWQADLGSPLVTPVLIGWDGRLFAFTSSGITAMTASGYRLWSFSLYSPLALPPVLDTAGGVIAVKSSGELLRFDPFGNVFSLTLGTVPQAITPLELNGLGHAILLLAANNNIEIIYNLQNANSPHENVHQSIIRLPIALPSPPAAALGLGNQTVVLMRNGNVALIAPQQGEVLWVSQSHI